MADVHNTIIVMLKYAPKAFGETLTEAQSRSSADWEALVQRLAEGQEEVAFLACDASGICGFVRGSRKDDYHSLPRDCVEVSQLWADPRRRGMGLGRALMKAVTDWAVSGNAVRIYLGVLKTNPEAVKFFEHLGYSDTKRRTIVSDTDRRESIVMVKILYG